ncbi:MAG: DUF1236 domain-containing protein [Methylovirgula sp.]
MRNEIKVLAIMAALAVPAAAQAQGVVRGTAQGAAEGGAAAGPVGAVVGGVVGGVTGGVAGLLGADQYPTFHHYIVEEDIPSYRYGGPVRVGAMLPDRDIRYYAVPPRFHVADTYRYTVIDNRPVIVDQRHRIVEVID